MNSDRRLRDSYGAHLLSQRNVAREGCVSLERIDALVSREGSEGDRLATMDHIMACSACQREFEQLRALRHAGNERVGIRYQGLIAAAVLVVVVGAGLLWRGSDRPGPVEFRGGPDALTVVAPIGAVAAGTGLSFTWHALPGAPSYHFELLDADRGTVLFTARSADTVFRLPDSVALAGGSTYAWWVQAGPPDAAGPRSAAVRFTLTQP